MQIDLYLACWGINKDDEKLKKIIALIEMNSYRVIFV